MEASKKKGIAIKKKTIDHWAFLEHIEAPMWVDLILEAKSGGVDTGDDDWFNTSHPFHQMSARELKSKFSQTGEEMLTSGVDLQGVNSPELPSSVSRSRGKHYNSKKWEGVDLNNLLDKQKGMRLLSGKSGSTTRSTITSDITQKYREKKCLEVSSQPCDQKSRSSSIISTRRSYILGKASNVEIDSDGMQSRGRKSSTGKSSVGSCSNPGYEVKFVSRQQREKITDEKGEVAMNLAVNNRSKPGEISKTSAKFGNRKESNITFGKPAYHRTAKSLVQYPSTSSKALLQHTVNKENICTGGAKEKLRNSKVNSLTSKGKEITTRNVTANQKCISRGVSQKGDTTGSTALTKVVL
uniref:Uncharacterized protein n=1 Tax=Cajanus cajan TaxID=3821 RepID=A0A151QX56_CAJCA|nr:hypothetical protein KK1_044074 [Cajanus cajan]